ncbi:MAG: Hint domain-containing protein [Gemmatales bacterium]|nr:Hint domain-containing protein [Gemmatales bacterium]
MSTHKPIRESSGGRKWKWLARSWLAVGLVVSAVLFLRAMPHSPLEWIEDEFDPETNTIELDLPELGAEGTAKVLRIGPCPPIASGPGHVVTATFKHEPDGELLTVVVGNDEIGCTANHPFWSEDRQEFVEAGQLRQGERVRTRLEQVAAVVAIKPRPPTDWVYNLEVQGEHVYEVGPNGVLVHNWCFKISKLHEDWAKKGCHVHVGKVEVLIRPDHQGGFVFRKAFSKTSDKAFEAAVKALRRDVKDPAARRLIHDEAERALEYLRQLSRQGGELGRMAQEKAAEIKFLIHALRRAGI